MTEIMTNYEFIEKHTCKMYLIGSFVLPHEVNVIQLLQEGQDAEYKQLVAQMNAVEGDGDMRDNPHRTTNNEVSRINEAVESLAKFKMTTVVDYPKATEQRTTIGSRVRLAHKSDGEESMLDIVGFRLGYPRGVIDPLSSEEVTALSLESPVSQAILGYEAGIERSFQTTSGATEIVRIISVDQLAVAEQFTQDN